jgi:hypothetical protein
MNATTISGSSTNSLSSSTTNVVTASNDAPSTTVSNGTIATVTITELPAAMETFAKGGEIAQIAEGTKHAMILHLCLPYSAFMVLVITAGIMGFL